MQSSTYHRLFAGPVCTTRPIRHAQAQKHLAVELIAEILSYLTDSRDISSVLATSRQLRGIMLPKLYKDVFIRVNYNLGDKLAAFAACLNSPCTPHKSCAAQVESLTLYYCQASYISNLNDFIPPLYRLLTKLPNLTELTLRLPPITPRAIDVWIKPADIDLRVQLPFKVLCLYTPQPWNLASDLVTHTHTRTTPLDEWLFAQQRVARVDYCPTDPAPLKFGRHAFPGVRALQASPESFAMMDGMVGARPLTHLRLADGRCAIMAEEVLERGLPQALCDVRALTDHGLELADVFPRLQRVDIEYGGDEYNSDLMRLLAALRDEGKARKGNLPKLRFLRSWGTVLTEEGRRAVGEVFRELAELEYFEILRDDGRSMRYARWELAGCSVEMQGRGGVVP
ncbi:hypothetical protein EYR36_001834 [Pleurotus pulmonarius]|nr:hypothetical protein EYR36_008225 [Pleurotus pulmonarius]KAF4580014.1 hypothetical protein EYR36_001834 [Pleurotus pulmonarius]